MSEWKLVGKLDKRSAFAGYPLESLHKQIQKLVPDITSVTEVGVSKKTNEFLRTKVSNYAKKKYPYLTKKYLELSVAMEMLNYSPCDVSKENTENGKVEDFCIYVRRSE